MDDMQQTRTRRRGLGLAARDAVRGWDIGEQPRKPPEVTAEPPKPAEPWKPLPMGEGGKFVAGPEQDGAHAMWSADLQRAARAAGIDAQWQPTQGAGGGYWKGITPDKSAEFTELVRKTGQAAPATSDERAKADVKKVPPADIDGFLAAMRKAGR